MTADELITILRQGEGTRVEFKIEFPEQTHAIGKEISALANTGGGVLLMGVSDEGAPLGIENADRAVERLAGIARNCDLSPEIDKFQVSKSIFVVYARIRSCPPCFYGGKIYHRVGSTSVECTNGEQLRHILERGSADQIKKGKSTTTTQPGRPRPPKTDEATFVAEMKRKGLRRELAAARSILEWSTEKFSINWGQASFSPVLDYGGDFTFNPLTIYTDGKVEIQFQRMAKRTKPFEQERKRLEFLHRLNDIPGVKLPRNSINKFPRFPLARLADESAISQFKSAIEWAVNVVKKANRQH